MLMLTIASVWCYHCWCWAGVICWPHGDTRVVMIHPLWNMNVRMCLANPVSINEMCLGFILFFSLFCPSWHIFWHITGRSIFLGFILLGPVQTFNTIHSPDANRNFNVMIVSEKTFFKNPVYPPGSMTVWTNYHNHPPIDRYFSLENVF